MEITETLYVTDRSRWRKWLQKNHSRKKEIWLIYYKKHSGKKRISYEDAVQEALCFGWIDSIVKKVDEERTAQRFSPRKSTSVLSQTNKERIRGLIKKKLMTPSGIRAVSHAFDPESDDPNDFKIPVQILNAIKKDRDAWVHFQKLPPHYVRIKIDYILGRKYHSKEAYRASLNHFIKMTAQGKRFGFVK